MSLMDSLHLEGVEADVNKIPDGKYEGVVSASRYVVTKAGDVNHVVTYRVTQEGPFKGREKDEWFKLGTNPVYDDSPAKKLVGMTPTMSEQAKPWYKKRFVDLGIPEDKVATVGPEALIGIPVEFGVKTNGAYVNVNFAQKRTNAAPVTTDAVAAVDGITPGGTSPNPNPVSVDPTQGSVSPTSPPSSEVDPSTLM